MITYARSAENIASRMRSRGYNITHKMITTTWCDFYLNGNFIFCSEMQINGERATEEILLEIMRGQICLSSCQNQKNKTDT